MRRDLTGTSLARRALSCALAFALALGTVPTAPALADERAAGEAQARAYLGFSDVDPGEWYATADVLGYAVENGLLAGYGNGRFGPDDPVTRGQVATILWRVAGEPAADAEDFSDVDYGEYYGAAVEWARSTGVVSGYGETNSFGPDEPVTREQLAAMLSNYAGKVAGLDASSDCAALDAVAGAEQVSPWAREAMGWAVDEGILSGVVSPDGTARVDPQGTALRCQVAKMASVFHRDVLPPDVDADYDNTIDYADGVTVVEGADYDVAFDGTVSIDAADLPQGVSAGDELVFSPTAANPEGAVLRVAAVSEEGGRIELSGTSPGLLDVVDRIDVEGVTLAEGVEVVPAEGVEMASDPASRAVVDFGTFELTYKSLSFEITPSAEFKLDIESRDVEEVYLAVMLNEKVTGTLADASASLDVKLCDVNMPTSVPGLFFSLAVWAEVAASGEVVLTVSNETTVGVRCRTGEFESIFLNDGDVAVELQATVRSGFDLTASLDFLNKPTVDASLGGGVQFKADGMVVRDDGTVCSDVESSLYADVGIGQHDSVLHDLGVSWSTDLADVGLSSLHFENGAFVPACSWGTDPGDVAPSAEFDYAVADWIEGAEPREYPVDASLFLPYGCRLDDSRVDQGGHGVWAEKHGHYGVDAGMYAPSSFDCGHGAYVFGYEGEAEEIVLPREIDGEPVVFAAVTVEEGQRLDLSEASFLRAVLVWGDGAGGIEFGEGSGLESVFLEWTDGPYLDMRGQTGIEDVSFNATNAGFALDKAGLKSFRAFISPLGALDFAGARSLESVSVYGAPLDSLNVDGCSSLRHLSCEGSGLTELDVSGCPNLTELYCAYNDIADVTALEEWLAQPGHAGSIFPQNASV